MATEDTMSTQDEAAPGAYTKEEVRAMVLDMVRGYASYWANEDRVKTEQERCDGLAFSIMNIFDGTTAALPAFDIVARPHPDDKEYCISQGEKYFPDGMAINDDCMLHEMYHRE